MAEYASDPGAGVFSLSQIRHLMRVEFGRAQRYGYPLSCLVIGIDRLDALRDQHGYEFRETAVAAVIELLQQETRTCDYLGRLMDDRLMGILPHTTAEGAEAGARRILGAARAVALRAPAAIGPGARGENPIRLTLSIGISHYENDNTLFFDSLVEAAEGALAEALRSGGDRFVHRIPGPREARAR